MRLQRQKLPTDTGEVRRNHGPVCCLLALLRVVNNRFRIAVIPDNDRPSAVTFSETTGYAPGLVSHR